MTAKHLQQIEQLAKDRGVILEKKFIKHCDPNNPESTVKLCNDELEWIQTIRIVNVMDDVANNLWRESKSRDPKKIASARHKVERAHKDLEMVALTHLWGKTGRAILSETKGKVFWGPTSP